MALWLEPESFRCAYVAYTRRQRPQARESRVLRLGETLVGLDELYARYLEGDPDELESLFATQLHADSWKPVAGRLRPQLGQAPTSEDTLVFPCGELTVGLVVDGPEGEWVRSNEAATWGRSPAELLRHAVGQLEQVTEGLGFTFQRGAPDGFVAFETSDGFDAARLLLPGLRERLVQRLGERFYAGVPNREYLICWAADASAEFHEFTRNRIREDHATHSQPLSGGVLEVSCDGVKTSQLQLLAG